MSSQPAKLNYFFGKGYRDLGNTIKDNFILLWRSIRKCARRIKDIGLGGFTPLGAIKIGYNVGLLLCICFISTAVCLAFSVVHVVLTLAMMLVVYVLFSLLWLLDTVMCKIRQIASSCPQCQRKFALPYYRCSCGRIHTKLKPSRYGILKRVCLCGRKLPTTFFNGRQRLNALCPNCKFNLKGGGFNTDISIPVLGGPSSGKTCFINMGLAELEAIAGPEFGFDFEYIDQGAGTGNYKADIAELRKGRLPAKTSEMQLVYSTFYFSPQKSKVRNKVSLCDVGGEVYAVNKGIDKQVGFSVANGYLMIVDPLSIETFRQQLERNKTDLSKYRASSMPIDEVLSILITTVENMRNLTAKQKIDKNLAIVFTKCDIPELDELIGEKAINDNALGKSKKVKMEVCNKLCEEFLINNDEAAFVNIVKTKFTNVQYFTSSALGHNEDGTAFKSSGVADPILWLIDKQSPTIDFAKHWNK